MGAKEGDFYPEDLRDEIDEINDFVYDRITTEFTRRALQQNKKFIKRKQKMYLMP